jgi:L-serine dehydratase
VHSEGHPPYRFRAASDLIYDRRERLPGHANGMQFFAYDADGTLLLRRVYYSVGGGFVVSDADLDAGAPEAAATDVPYPFASAARPAW